MPRPYFMLRLPDLGRMEVFELLGDSDEISRVKSLLDGSVPMPNEKDNYAFEERYGTLDLTDFSDEDCLYGLDTWEVKEPDVTAVVDAFRDYFEREIGTPIGPTIVRTLPEA